jgi:hypothetical protein
MYFSFIGKHGYRFDFRSCLISASVFLLLPFPFANAAGDAAQGRRDYDYTCGRCHGSPQPGKPGAFSDYDVTANPLSVYASDPSALTKSANEGYVIPAGNSNNDYPPGAKTSEPMESFAGTGPKRFGEGTTPTTYAINISAYFASLFSAPNSPTISAVKGENGSAQVSFSAPKSDLSITGYSVSSNPGEITATGLSSPITVKGLTNGTSYTFKVTATSNAGSSKPSSPSNAVTPVADNVPPALPVKAATAVAAISLAIPVAQAKIATPAVAAIPHPAQVKAASAVSSGTPLASTAILKPVPAVATPHSAVVAAAPATHAQAPVPSHPVAQKTVLQAPVMKMARAGGASARVFFGTPAESASITSYTVTALTGGAATGITATGPKSPITISGLTNGTVYTFTVTANSSAGASEASEKSNTVIPLKILGD